MTKKNVTRRDLMKYAAMGGVASASMAVGHNAFAAGGGGGLNVVETPHIRYSQPSVFALAGGSAQAAAFSTGEVRVGVGRASGFTATVQQGITIKLKFEITVTTISLETFNSYKTSVTNTLSQAQQSEMQSAGGYSESAHYFANLFGVGFHRNKNFYLQNKSSNYTVTQANTTQEAIAKSTYNLKTESIKLKGSVEAVGTSLIPTQAAVFVQTTQFIFNDNKNLLVFNTSNKPGFGPVAAQPDGSTAGVETKNPVISLA